MNRNKRRNQPTQQQESRVESRRVNEAGETAAEPFTAQPEIQALALVMAATIDESGAEHGAIIGGGDFYTRFTRVMYVLTWESPAFTMQSMKYIADATVSVSRKANDQEPLNQRISQLLDTFARCIYPNTPILLSKEEVMALARIRRHLKGEDITEGIASGAVSFAMQQWLKVLGLSLGDTKQYSETLLRSLAHTAIAQGLQAPGADIKLPDSSQHSATLAKLVNDILRQTCTKGYTFHSAAGAFLRIEG